MLSYLRPLNIHTESEPTLVTPWHPVFVAGNWTFPCRIANPCPLYMDCVYNLVLSSGHVITINGLQFITLGHGNDTHPVLAHAFFGTRVCARLCPCVNVWTNADAGCGTCCSPEGLRSRRRRC